MTINIHIESLTLNIDKLVLPTEEDTGENNLKAAMSSAIEDTIKINFPYPEDEEKVPQCKDGFCELPTYT